MKYNRRLKIGPNLASRSNECAFLTEIKGLRL